MTRYNAPCMGISSFEDLALGSDKEEDVAVTVELETPISVSCPSG